MAEKQYDDAETVAMTADDDAHVTDAAVEAYSVLQATAEAQDAAE